MNLADAAFQKPLERGSQETENAAFLSAQKRYRDKVRYYTELTKRGSIPRNAWEAATINYGHPLEIYFDIIT